ncbi:hypothetical protein [Ligilactobacillus acidipiscis]|uniref:hypothetical protein n=1 Tax=Ligilactobacillus acidipiscis TaxID=89059 RepID=UPI0023F8D758|nr:hypothetical protein [Ligilactobacillus acidipiscis]WEV56798.1 hypothetical protein OZX66_11315 [Ligilactobacillus acidipiscis]
MFENDGFAALIPRQKGKTEHNEKEKSIQPQALPLSEKQAYEEEIMQLKAQLHQAEIEYDLLKNFRSGRKVYEQSESHSCRFSAGYFSTMTGEATKEVFAVKISACPDKKWSWKQ